MRVKAVLGYDGTAYSGFQFQINAPSIQAEVERVLAELTQTPIRITAAGRTDAGVHARGQVVAFDTAWRHSIADLLRGMNALLPEDIVIFELDVVDPAFHPRFDALRRRYRYTIYREAVRNPLVARYSLHVPQSLDLAAMQAAADCLIGRHDFFAFGSPPQGVNSVRDVSCAAWSFNAPWLTFDIEANAFLYRMVRMVVGTLLRVGLGALTPVAFREILEARRRENAGPAAAAKALCLESVLYASG